MVRLNPNVLDSEQPASAQKGYIARLGVFGGTFDPPHIGHLILAEEALFQLDLDLVLWVLTPNPPHKSDRPISPLEVRLSLLKAAIRGHPRFNLSTVDIDRPPPHYAVDTLGFISKQYPTAVLYYLIGGDSLRDLPKWHKPFMLLRQCPTLGVMRRPGDQVDMPALEKELPGITKHIHWIDAPLLDISASSIRERIKSGQGYRYYLHPAVYHLISQKQYYRGDP